MVSGTYLLLEILGSAALLLWGVRMARTSVMRAHGSQIRRLLPRVLRNRWLAAGAGLAAAGVLQSSTAVAVFTASLAGMGLVPATGGLALMLGADAGSALVAALLTLNIRGLWPLLILVGYVMHSAFGESNSRIRQHGRFLLGLGLVMLALNSMGGFAGHIASSNVARMLISALTDEAGLVVLIMTVLTWVSHSSLAILLFLAALVQEGVVADPGIIVPAILGVNLGAGIPAVVLTWRQAPAARRIILGNACFRMAGVAICLVFLRPVIALFELLPGVDGLRVVEFHTLFNLFIVVLFIGLLDQAAALMERIVPVPPPAEEEFGPRYIPPIPGAFQAALPLSALTREALRMSDVIHAMLEQTRTILSSRTYVGKDKVLQVKRMDDRADTLYKAIRGYAVDLTRSDLPEDELRRVNTLLRYALSLENVGDIIDKSLLDITAQKNRERLSFSDDGHDELARLFAYVLGTLELTADMIMGWRAEMAPRVDARRGEFKRMVNESSERHIERLRRGVSNSLETSTYHLDAISDLQRINSLVAGIADDVTAAAACEKCET
jgi:phosphate:Na+ symporter